MKSVGIIGCGWIFQSEHLLGYLATKNGYIKGFFDVDTALAEKAKAAYLDGLEKSNNGTAILTIVKKETKVYKDYNELIKDVELIDICTPPVYHTFYAKLAAEAKKGILCEKPFARSYWDAKETIDSIKKSRSSFYMFTQVIYNDIFKYGKKLIDDGVIGDIIRVKNAHATKDLDHTVSNKNFWNPMVSGGGALADIGPHAYSVQKYWIGEKYRLKSVKDNGIETRITRRDIQGEDSDVKVEDIARIELEWESQGKTIKGEIEAYWGDNPYKFGLYHEIEGTKGIMKF